MKLRTVSFEVAKQLRAVGFNEMCNYGYDKDGCGHDLTGYAVDNLDIINSHNKNYRLYGGGVTAPSQALVVEWLIEKHLFELVVYCNACGWLYEINTAHVEGEVSGGTHIMWSDNKGTNEGGCWDHKGEATDEGIKDIIMYINKLKKERV